MKRNLRPEATANSILDIPCDWFNMHGVKALLIDLDNTLCHWRGQPAACVRAWLSAVAGTGVRVLIVSNGGKRVLAAASAAGVDCITNAKKPACKKTAALLNKLGISAKYACVVGDQLLTDIALAKKLNCKSILVKPMANKELVFTRFNRLREVIIWKSVFGCKKSAFVFNGFNCIER